MEALELLQRRRATTQDLQSIVRTMKALSAVTIHRCERASQAVSAYDATVDLGLQILLRDPEVAGRAIRAAERAAEQGQTGIIVLGSDHGLCGRSNDIVTRAALDEIASRSDQVPFLAAVGARVASGLEVAGHAPSIVYANPGSVGGIGETTGAMLGLVEDWRRTRDVVRVRIIHNVQTDESPARPVNVGLLPLSPAYLRDQARRPWRSRRLPTYTEDRDTLLARLVRQHIFVRVYRALAESQASEHATRLAAMQAAERSIRDHLSDLDAAYRHRRQEAITTELLDVVAGFAVLRDAQG